MHILLVEDDPEDAQWIREQLEGTAKGPFHLQWVQRLSEALRCLETERVEVVLLDLSLPDSLGLDTFHAIHRKTLDIPVVVQTDLEDESVAVKAVQAGAQDYLVKSKIHGEVIWRVMTYGIERARREMVMRGLLEDLQKKQKELEEAYAHLKATQNDLIEAEKFSALGRFSLGVAHEVKNPLGIVLGGVEFLEKRLSKAHIDADVQKALGKVKESTLRADRIFKQLLTSARPSPLRVERVDPADLVREALALLQYRIDGKRVAVHTEFAPDSLWIDVDKNQMQQVLFNILINGVEAMPHGGTLTVRTLAAHASQDPEGPRCVIEIKDTGQGVSPENLPKLFEPFFTTKRDQKGTGLGLSVAKMIVENHRGALRVESRLGEGTTFQIFLP